MIILKAPVDACRMSGITIFIYLFLLLLLCYKPPILNNKTVLSLIKKVTICGFACVLVLYFSTPVCGNGYAPLRFTFSIPYRPLGVSGSKNSKKYFDIPGTHRSIFTASFPLTQTGPHG